MEVEFNLPLETGTILPEDMFLCHPVSSWHLPGPNDYLDTTEEVTVCFILGEADPNPTHIQCTLNICL